MNLLKQIFGGGWLTLATLIGKIVSAFQQAAHDKKVADGAVAEAKLKGMQDETAKVDAAIAAGNDSERVLVNNDPHNRATKRKSRGV